MSSDAGDRRADGGKFAIEHAAKLLGQGKAERLLISGADPSVRKETRATSWRKRALFACCVDLGSESVDTRSNGESEALARAARLYQLGSSRADWHMRRARYEFEHALGRDYRIVFDAVKTENG